MILSNDGEKLHTLSPLQVNQEFEKMGRSFWSPITKEEFNDHIEYRIRELRKILPLVEADFEALQLLIPKGEVSRQEYIEFFKNKSSMMDELIKDGFSGFLYIYDLQRGISNVEDKFREEFEDLLFSHQHLIEQIRMLRNNLASSALSKLEQDVAKGLNTFEEAQTYYWISSITKGLVGEEKAVPPLRLAVKQLKKHLRTNSKDAKALKILILSYKGLGRTDAAYELEMELKKVEIQNPVISLDPITEYDKSGLTFEIKCQKLFDSMGFTTKATSLTNDGGIDIVAIRNDPILSGKYIVQCKDWQANVGVKPVRELYGVIVSEEANKGILITSSQFTQSAIEFAKDKRIELIDGEQLEKLFVSFLPQE